jgi:hypothetical protein
MENIIMTIVLAIIAALTAYGVKLIRDARATASKSGWLYVLEHGAAVGVRFVEQTMEKYTNEEKLGAAIDYVYAYLDRAGVNFTEDDKLIIKGAIEAALLKFKTEIEPV